MNRFDQQQTTAQQVGSDDEASRIGRANGDGAEPPATLGAMEYDYTNFYFGAGDDAFALLQPFQEWWERAKTQGYYQYELPLQAAPSTRVAVRDTLTGDVREDLINFASYNYLGLSYRPEVKDAIKRAVDLYGGGSSGSPILSGTTELHRRLAREIAAFKDKEAALIFPTGYSANVGVISGLMRPGDLVIADQWAHASIVDGMILSKATGRFFRHNEVADLEKKLSRSEGKKLVVVEGVYSMHGDVPPLADIVDVCRRHGARLMIDEAHSAFLFGEHGRGVVEALGLEDEVDIHLGTFSKSLGGQGGYVTGSAPLVNYLRGFSRSRFFSCALAPTVVAGLLEALRIVRDEPELRARLWRNVATMKALLDEAGVPTGESVSQVIPIMVKDDARIFAMGEALLREGVFINPVKYPAVRKHKSRFRMSISAAHTDDELEAGAEIITRVLDRFGVTDG